MAEIAPDALVINRVYTRVVGEVAEDASLGNAQTFDIVVQWSAGRSANQALGGGADVSVEINTFELNHPPPGPPAYVGILSNSLPGGNTGTDGENHDGTYEFVLGPLGPMGAVHAGHMYWSVVQLVRVAAPAGASVDFGQCMFHIT